MVKKRYCYEYQGMIMLTSSTFQERLRLSSKALLPRKIERYADGREQQLLAWITLLSTKTEEEQALSLIHI